MSKLRKTHYQLGQGGNPVVSQA